MKTVIIPNYIPHQGIKKELAEFGKVIPAEYASIDSLSSKDLIYNPLSCFPVYKKIMEKRKDTGIFRMRRIFPRVEEDKLVVSMDIYELSKHFGEIEKISYKNHKKHSTVHLLFHTGIMSQMDYSFGYPFHLELEWNGIQSLMQYDVSLHRSFKNENKVIEAYGLNQEDILRSAYSGEEVRQMLEVLP